MEQTSTERGEIVEAEYAERVNQIASEIGKRWDNGEIQIRETIFEAIRRGSALGRAVQSLEAADLISELLGALEAFVDGDSGDSIDTRYENARQAITKARGGAE